jgi:hypothetical protein
MVKKQNLHKTFFLFIFVLIFCTQNELKAQTLIPDEISLEQTVYANLKNGRAEFQGITEKHTFMVTGKADPASTIKSLKADKRVINVVHDAKRNAFVVTINKTSLNEARLWLQPMIESDKVKVASHEVQYFKKAD